MGSTSGSRKSPGEGHGNPLTVFLPRESHGQRSLEATVHRVAKSQTQLSNLARRHTDRGGWCWVSKCSPKREALPRPQYSQCLWLWLTPASTGCPPDVRWGSGSRCVSGVWYLQTWEGKCFLAELQCTQQIPGWTSLLPPRGRAKPGQSRRGRWWKRCWTELPVGQTHNRASGGRVSFPVWKNDCRGLSLPHPRKTFTGDLITSHHVKKHYKIEKRKEKEKKNYFLSKV